MGIYVADNKENITYVNPAFANMAGYTQKQLLGMNVSQIADKGEFNKIREMTKLRRRGKKSTYDVVLNNRSGDKINVLISGSPLTTAEGRIENTLAVITDITERKNAEDALKESEEKFRNLAEKSPNMIFINCKGRMLYVNEISSEIMGYKREEFYSPDFDFLTLIASEFKDKMKSNFNRHKKGREAAPSELAFITRDGKRIEVIYTSKLIEYGGESAVLGIVTDITERKKAEEELKMTYTAIESSLNAVFASNLVGKVTYANVAAAELWGFDNTEDMIGTDVLDYWTDESKKKAKEIIRALRDRGRYEGGGLTGLKRNGTEFSVEIKSTILKDKSGNPIGMVGTFSEVI